MEKIKWSEKITNLVLEQIEENRTLLNNILRRKANWIGKSLVKMFLSLSNLVCRLLND